MLTTSARLLQLLTLLQSRRDWSGEELARRMEVTGRTVRRDVDRLRDLGYTVEARPGSGGGYCLGPGSGVPPLLLNAEEAVAVAVALRTVASTGLAGVADAAVQALVKFDQTLPAALRRRVQLLQDQVLAVAGPGPQADPGVLIEVATAVRDRHRLQAGYTDHRGELTHRVLEPHRILHVSGVWYVLAWDVERDDWRTFRLDRLVPRGHPGRRFEGRDLPDAEVTERVLAGVTTLAYAHHCRMRVEAPAARVAELVGLTAARVEPVGEDACEVTWGSHDLGRTAVWLAGLDVQVVVLEPPALVDAVAALARRLSQAAGHRSDVEPTQCLGVDVSSVGAF